MSNLIVDKLRRSENDSSAELLLRLDRLETLVQKQNAAITALSDRVLSDYSTLDAVNYSHSSSPVVSPQTRRQIFHSTLGSLPTQGPALFNSGVRQAYMENDPILIPLGHQTPTGNLLGLEPIRKLIGHYSQDFFLLLESERKEPSLIPRTSISTIREELGQDPSTTSSIISNFFTHIHSQFPVLEKDLFSKQFERFLGKSQIHEAETALCLTVLALGEIFSVHNDLFDMNSSLDGIGGEYFAHAYQILRSGQTTLFSRDQTVPLTFFYASLYFRYTGRPLQAWKLVHTASTGVQLIYS